MPKIWVIPDIHGCSRTLKALVENMILPEKSDHLIFLGDYIDRGPDSKGVIDYIIGLEEQGYHVTTLMGNHEDYCLTAWEDDQNIKGFLGIVPKSKTQREWELYGGKQCIESFGVERPREIPDKYIEWMKKLKYFVELDKFIVVHAGFNFEEENPFDDKFSMLWIREFEVVPEKINHKKLIHGHVPVNLEFIDMAVNNPESNFIDIDNGVYFESRPGYGNLIALELNSMEYTAHSLLDTVDYKKFL